MSLLDSPPPDVFSQDSRFEEFIAKECTSYKEGTSRRVYLTDNGRYVVKVALTPENTTDNWVEITAFLHYVKDRDKLAFIHSWSISGKFLVMEKLDMTIASMQSFDYPFWVTDKKHSNIGKSVDGKLKICDYALVKDSDYGYQSDFI